jgi:fructose-1,6-bisphosphatase/sedoheptulose 1,7-bisphosphatase-like protein
VAQALASATSASAAKRRVIDNAAIHAMRRTVCPSGYMQATLASEGEAAPKPNA